MFEHFWFTFKNFSITFTQTHKRTKIFRYGFPLLLIVIVIFLKTVLNAVIGEQIRYHILTLVVTISALYGGLGPGLFATALSGFVNNYFFLLPNTTYFSSENILAIGIFMVVGVTISLLSEARRQADIQKDEFIGIVSHEIKTPVTAIKAYTQLLIKISKKNKDKTITNFAEKVELQANNIATIINDLLDITKIASGELSYKDERFIVYEVLKQCVEEQQLVAKQHKIIFLGESDKIAFADRQRIRQVINNLLTNAIKYSPDADKIDVKVQDRKKGIEISFRDYGIGISKEEQKHIFDRFFRSKNAEESAVKGLGLGLYISTRIVKKYNGRLWAKSNPKKGTTFYLFLPS